MRVIEPRRVAERERIVPASPIKVWDEGVTIDVNARSQIADTAELPFIHSHVAVMPDAHFGFGSTVGTVIPTRGAIVPSAVGVDIGCGMVAQRLNMTSQRLPDNLQGVYDAIMAAVPVGFNAHDEPPVAFDDLRGKLIYAPGYNEIKAAGLWNARVDPLQQIGTLGGGNHFIELCIDEGDAIWVMLHSGSRGLGNRVGQHFIALAKRECERWMIDLPNRDLAFLPEDTDGFNDYVAAVGWCQDYARLNRDVMMRLSLDAIAKELGTFTCNSSQAINCHHNYVEREHHFGANVWVTRKGAVRAREGDMGIIPGAMGRRSFIVRGKGCAESFHSCSHGGGRVMSRTEARKKITLEEHARDTEGLVCRKDAGVLDESSRAYKDIDAVMAAQADLVDVVHTLRAVVCVKG